MSAAKSPLLLAGALAVLGCITANARGQYQLPLPAVDLLPDGSASYQLRDWRAVAANFDGDGRMDWFISALVDVPGEIDDHSGNRLRRRPVL